MNCGSPAAIEDFLSNIVQKASIQLRVFARVGDDDPCAALTLMRLCGHRSALTFFMRAMGPTPCLAQIDAILPEVLMPLTGPLTTLAATSQVALAPSGGGFGLPPLTVLAPIAHCASWSASMKLFPLILASVAPISLLSSPALAPFPKVTAAMADIFSSAVDNDEATPGRRLQKTLTALFQTSLAESLFSAGSREDKARFQSLRAKTASLWMCPVPATCQEKIWMSPDNFRATCRLRLGLPVADVEVRCAACAANSKTSTQDVLGYHAICCMAGGDRTHTHNNLLKQLFADASFGLMHPVWEVHPFGDNQRMDFVIRNGEAEQLVDLALTFPLQKNSVAAAVTTPGGAATQYEAIKRKKYERFLSRGQTLVPLVFDTFGAAGASARPLLDRIAGAFSRRFGSRIGRTIFFTRINVVLLSQVAAIIVGHT